MEADIKTREQKNINAYHKDDIDAAYTFSAELKKEVGKFIKAIVLFGSQARTEGEESHDLDVLVVLDDVSIYLNREFVQTYRIIVQNLIGKISRRLHVTTLRFTSFWEYVRNGDPIAINILRDGVPLIDTDFFRPLQLLLYQGRIRPTPEAIWNYYLKAPNTLSNSKFRVIDANVDLYWAVIDAAHGALMAIGEIPPSPSHVADLLDQKLINRGLLPKKYSKIMRHFYKLSKAIEQKQVEGMNGAEYDKNYELAEDFVKRMKTFIEARK